MVTGVGSIAGWGNINRVQVSTMSAVTAAALCAIRFPHEVARAIVAAKQATCYYLPVGKILGSWADEMDLPILAVPDLSQSIASFLASVKPLLSEQEFSETEAAAKKLPEEARWAQAKLHALALTRVNWAEELWIKGAYLLCRDSILTSSWYGTDAVIPRKFEEGVDPQTVRAASVINQLVDFNDRIKRGDISEASEYRYTSRDGSGEKVVPLSIYQFRRAFGAYQVPTKGCDVIRETPDSKHIIVLCNGREYVLPVYDEDGTRCTHAEIYANLQKIKNYAEKRPNPFPNIGILSSQNRDVWAEDRAQLLQLQNKSGIASNVPPMEMRETALFMLTIDDESFTTPKEMANVALHGRNNREFDMTNVIVGTNGSFCAIVPHAKADATTEGTIFNTVMSKEEEAFVDGVMKAPESVETDFTPAPLTFNLPGTLLEKKLNLEEKVQKKIDVHVEEFRAFSIEALKKLGVSPDSFIQVAIMKTVREALGRDVLTYESASLKAFRHGRTETIRSFTEEVKAFLDGPSKESLLAAINSHKKRAVEAVMGRGCDRHLMLGLRFLLPQHPFFESPGAKLQFTNATSQTPCRHSMGGGFRPVTPDGIGISYDPKVQVEGFNFHITRFEYQEVSAEKFGVMLSNNLKQLRDILIGK